MARLIAELFGKGRLDYDYQPPVAILKALLHMNRYGLDRPTPIGLRVPDPIFPAQPQHGSGMAEARIRQLLPILLEMSPREDRRTLIALANSR